MDVWKLFSCELNEKSQEMASVFFQVCVDFLLLEILKI